MSSSRGGPLAGLRSRRSQIAPRERIVAGRTAARVKELICRSTIWPLGAERRMPGSLRYPNGPDAPYPADEPEALTREVPIA